MGILGHLCGETVSKRFLIIEDLIIITLALVYCSLVATQQEMKDRPVKLLRLLFSIESSIKVSGFSWRVI